MDEEPASDAPGAGVRCGNDCAERSAVRSGASREFAGTWCGDDLTAASVDGPGVELTATDD